MQIQIPQELTLERQAFEARMGISNNQPTTSLDSIQITVHFEDDQGNPIEATSDPNNTTAKFFIRLEDGSGIPSSVAGGASASIKWLIIPAPGAGGQLATGKEYFVGATLKYNAQGKPEEIKVTPDSIQVKPLPEIVLDYFLPGEVYSDDPFTQAIEPPVPFSLGLRAKNLGYASAVNLNIDSGQPKIVQNELGLVVGFQIAGSEVNGKAAQPSFKVNFGDIAPNSAGTARWNMTSSLSGQFVDFKATLSHSDELGGQLTSLITAVNTHSLVHDVLVDLPGRDGIKDFLAKDGSVLRVYESDITDTEVQDKSAQASVGTAGGAVVVTINGSSNNGLVYAKLADPMNGEKVTQFVTRSDGKVLPKENAWFSKTFDKINTRWDYFVNVFDTTYTQDLQYTIGLADPLAGAQPPVLQFIPDKIVRPAQQLGFVALASDPNGPGPTMSTGPLPVGASFAQDNPGQGSFFWTPTAAQLGTYFVEFKATDEEGLVDSQQVRITVTDLATNLLAWQEQYWPGVTDPQVIGNQADPDGDALSNLIEYALNLDPTQPTVNGPQIGVVEEAGKKYLTLTYVKRTDDPSLSFLVIGANSLKTPDNQWITQTTLVPVNQMGVPGGMERVRIRDSIAIDDGPVRRFLKLKVSIQ